MKLVIDDNATLGIIQDDFNRMFPFLKVEFYGLSRENDHNPRMLKDKNRVIGQFRNKKQAGKIIIDEHTTVEDLDEHFNEIYGLQALIYRKSGKAWLKTTLTENWTLEEQNNQGKDLHKG